MSPDQMEPLKVAATNLLITLATARGTMEEFRESTAALPKMTKELNIAKRKQVAVVANLVSEFENAERLLSEAIDVIDGLI